MMSSQQLSLDNFITSDRRSRTVAGDDIPRTSGPGSTNSEPARPTGVADLFDSLFCPTGNTAVPNATPAIPINNENPQNDPDPITEHITQVFSQVISSLIHEVATPISTVVHELNDVVTTRLTIVDSSLNKTNSFHDSLSSSLLLTDRKLNELNAALTKVSETTNAVLTTARFSKELLGLEKRLRSMPKTAADVPQAPSGGGGDDFAKLIGVVQDMSAKIAALKSKLESVRLPSPFLDWRGDLINDLTSTIDQRASKTEQLMDQRVASSERLILAKLEEFFNRPSKEGSAPSDLPQQLESYSESQRTDSLALSNKLDRLSSLNQAEGA
ncbi:hypothetical protein MJO29_004518, partial [Puccinia striiformis f. sp. tritici]